MYTSKYTGEQADARLDSVLAQEVVTGTGTQSKTISANTFVSFGTMTSLSVTLGSPVSGITNEYAFEFDSGSTATTLSLPASIVWQDDPSSPEANKHYEISIKYDAATQTYYGLWAEWDLPTE